LNPKQKNEDQIKSNRFCEDQAAFVSALNVMSGVESSHDGLPTGKSNQSVRTRTRSARRKAFTVDDYIQGVLKGDRTALARAVTLIESNAVQHQETAQTVLSSLLPKTGKAIRIGISGVPGAGKSTLIEALGLALVAKGLKVAVLAVDPSSTVTKGSILGDKTRMEKLSRELNAFIRPSASGGTLGGVGRKTRETMILFEAAGFDVILVETVGVGQSEITVRSMVDFFLLVLISGAGDELQGIKKGVIEIADAILINKADGENLQPAKLARSEYENALHYLIPATRGWRTHAYTASALEGTGIEEIWNVIQTFKQVTLKSGIFAERRKSQVREWLHSMLQERILQMFYENPSVKAILPEMEADIMDGTLPTTRAAWNILQAFLTGTNKS